MLKHSSLLLQSVVELENEQLANELKTQNRLQQGAVDVAQAGEQTSICRAEAIPEA